MFPSLGRIAVAASGLPERSLKRRFRAAAGAAPINYVQNMRIDEAKRLLETGGASFEDVAGEVGYDTPAFFRRVFRSRTGFTPGSRGRPD
jgi:transcriptional regulator GlxA family with amidase domain